MLCDLRFRLRALFRTRAVEAELDDELRFHFEKEIEKYENAGLSHHEAMRCARLAFGGDDQVKDECRAARGTSFVEDLLHDVRYGLRAMVRNPVFFSIAALTLALAIGASTAVFSLVDTILLKPLPYPNAGRVMMLWRNAPPRLGGVFAWRPYEIGILMQTANTLENVGVFREDSFNLTGASNPELLEGVRATPEFFAALGVSPTLGRAFSLKDESPNHEYVVILSDRLWRTRFAADRAIIGKVINLNGSAYTVIGVMPQAFTFPNREGIPDILDVPRETQLWVPLFLSEPRQFDYPNAFGVIAEVKAGVSLARAQGDLAVFQKRLEEQVSAAKGWTSTAVPLAQETISDTHGPLLLLLGAVTVVLLIACTNVAGLALNRSLARCREFTVRSVLGAGRGRLIQQLMTESLLLAFSGGLLGVALSEAGILLARRLGPQTIPQLRETRFDFHVFAYAIGLTLITGVLSGLVPALGATRVNVAEALRERATRSSGNAAVWRIRNLLLTAQLALALVLVIAAGLLVGTFNRMLHSHSGFDATHVVTFELPLPAPQYNDPERMARVYKAILERLEKLPGVRSAGFCLRFLWGASPTARPFAFPNMQLRTAENCRM